MLFETTCCTIAIILEESLFLIHYSKLWRYICQTENEKQKDQNWNFAVLALQCRVECPSVAFFIVYLCPSGKYSSEKKENLTLSYRFLYCEKQFKYLILVCMFLIAGACAEFSCRPKIRGVALLPFLYSVA